MPHSKSCRAADGLSANRNIALLTALSLALFSHGNAFADNHSTLQDLTQYLATEYKMRPEDIVRVLPSITLDSSADGKLVRWETPNLSVAVLVVGHLHDYAEAVERRMSNLADITHRRVAFCDDQVSTGAGNAYSPAIEKLHCLARTPDIVDVIYDEDSAALFHDLRLQSKSPDAQTFWAKREAGANESSEQSTCGWHLDVDRDRSVFNSGVGYLHVGNRDDNHCVEALAYVLFGQIPIQVAEHRIAYSAEMLSILYAPELHAGMSLSDVTKVLKN